MTTDIIVVDVSHWQGKWPGEGTPWDAMRRNNLVGVILKATESTSYVDNTFRQRYDAAIANGIAVCAYHFLRPGKMPQQMDLFLNTVKPRQGERMVLDWEDAGVKSGDVAYCVEYLLGKRPDLQITVYASSSFLQSNAQYDDRLAKTSLWVARYSSQEPYWPENIWKTWTLWQCTDSFKVEGYGPLDGNKFNGSPENCIAWLNPAGAAPEPEPEPVPPPTPEVNITTTGSVRVVVNGQVVTYD